MSENKNKIKRSTFNKRILCLKKLINLLLSYKFIIECIADWLPPSEFKFQVQAYLRILFFLLHLARLKIKAMI